MADQPQPAQETRARTQGTRTLGALSGDLSDEIVTLLRDEVTLARAEMRRAALQALPGAGLLVAGGTTIYVGTLALLAAAILRLARTRPPWQASLIVGLTGVGLGGGLAWLGMDALKGVSLVPRQTIETLKEDAQWVRDRVS